MELNRYLQAEALSFLVINALMISSVPQAQRAQHAHNKYADRDRLLDNHVTRANKLHPPD